ncbi:GumC family protein [Agarivorans sp. QJM3NY_33]|uniref:GumC family protein n=1 Tax=Agarivorans sp. QJM3NY_33 TaxID=3421432 RepID=UPI003D7D7288
MVNHTAQRNVLHIDNPASRLGLNSLQRPVNKDEFIDLSQYFSVIRRRAWMIIGFTFLAALLAALITFSITPVYRASAVLLIEAEQRKAVSIEDVIGVDTSKQEYYLTQFELLKSRTIAQKVIQGLQLEQYPELNGEQADSGWMQLKNPLETLYNLGAHSPLLLSLLPLREPLSEQMLLQKRQQTVMENFRKRLSISPLRKTQLVKIIFESEDPQLAAQVANAVGEAYIENNRESRLYANQEASTWLETRLDKLRALVEQSESRQADFLTSEGLVDVSGVDSLASNELNDLSRRLSDARDRRVAAESLYYVLQDNRNAGLAELSSISVISNHPQLRDVRVAEIEAERLVSELSKRYGPKHDKMIQAQAQLAAVRERAGRVLNDLATGIEKELRGAVKQENSIQAELASKKTQFQAIAVKRATYDALKREVDSNRKLYDLFLNRQKETAATNDFQSAVARFSDRAVIPLDPAKPNKGLIIALVALASLLFSMVLVLITDAFHNTIEKSSDIQEKLGLHPLGAIPKINAKKYKNKLMDSQVFFDEKQRYFSESIRTIRTSLLFNLVNNQRKRVCITSSVPGEGKSTTAMNLAMAMAGMEKVLLIEADLRKPSLSERFGFNQNPLGLTNHLVMGAELSDCIYHHKKSGLDTLFGGMLIPNPQELLASNKFAMLIEQLEQRYDKIVIDSPPLLAVSDGLLLSRLAGAALLVVQAGSTNIKQLNSSLESLIKHDIAIDGVVINKASPKQKNEYGDYQYYGYQNQSGKATQS